MRLMLKFDSHLVLVREISSSPVLDVMVNTPGLGNHSSSIRARTEIRDNESSRCVVEMYYFSYGSNMSLRRLRLRVPSASCIGSGFLQEHELRFHKVSSRDGSAKCDAVFTASSDQCIHGVVYRIGEAEKPGLDRAEGLGFGYEQKNVWIEMEGGVEVQASCYFATEIAPHLKPLDWYREHVLRGARENNLPGAYIRSIEAIEAVADDDAVRREKELSIYR